MLKVSLRACLLALRALGALHLERRRLLVPTLDGVLAPSHQVVHVLQQLVPRHDTRRAVRLDEIRALRALRVGADLLAHVLTHASQLVLKLNAMLKVSLRACLLALRALGAM